MPVAWHSLSSNFTLRSRFVAGLALLVLLACNSGTSAFAQAKTLRGKRDSAVRRNNDLGGRSAADTPLLATRPGPDAPPSKFPLAILSESFLLAPSGANLRARITALKSRPDLAEPVVLRFNTLEPAPIIEQLARQGIAEKLLAREGDKLKTDFRRTVLGRIRDLRLSLEPRDLVWIDLQKLSATIAQTSVKPSVVAKQWKAALADPAKREDMRRHFKDAGPAILKSVERHLAGSPGERLIPAETFLPRHVRMLLGHYSPLRGRNCFATALGFNDPRVEFMDNINLVREEGHHSAMINNDEFAQALWLGYRELDASEVLEGLEFGDVVAFSDATEGDSYTGLKHAIVHIAGDVYLHKPSKSASTPIEFARWEGIARIWVSLTRELDYKVYRRLPTGSLRGRNSQIAIEKIFWSQ